MKSNNHWPKNQMTEVNLHIGINVNDLIYLKTVLNILKHKI